MISPAIGLPKRVVSQRTDVAKVVVCAFFIVTNTMKSVFDFVNF